MYRKDVYELPISAIREIIANAILHRSYLDKSCVQVCIFDDRLEVSSPGMLYGGLDIETAKIAEKITGKSSSTVRRYLKMLIETGYINTDGKTNNVKYVI